MMQYLFYLTITILGVSTTTTPTETDQQHACNSCCQGPAGLPGIPGTGHNGLPGRDGLRGEKGETGQKGDIGQKGDVGAGGDRGPAGTVGLSGEKGERGLRGLQGLPGKIGPHGLKGSAGVDAIGFPGEKGQKGEVGQKGESGESVARSAFTAAKTSSQTGNHRNVLTFDTTVTNYGDHFSTETSKFTCEIPGVYFFTVTLGRYNNGDPYVYLVKDNTNIVIVRFYDDPNHSYITQTTHSAVLQLAAGEQVWVKIGSNGQRVYSDSNKYTSFSGFLLFEI